METGKRLSLAQQLAQLDEPAPIDYDPEGLNAYERGSDDEGKDAASSAAREHYFEVGPSALRKLRDSIADPKYEGVKTTRRKLMEMEEEEDSEGEQEEGSREDQQLKDQEEDDEAPSESESEGEEEEEEEEEEIEGYRAENEEETGAEKEDEEEEHREMESQPALSPKRKSTEHADDLKSALQKTREEDLMKGKAVMRQLNIWDSLLDARIKLQKTVTTMNKIASARSLLESSECQEYLQKYLEESILLTEDLFELQETILSMNEIATPPPRKKRRIQEDDDVEKYSTYFVEASGSSAKLEQALHPWLIQTLSKWSAKIQAVAPSVLLSSNRNTFSKKSQQVKSALQLVDEALQDNPRLLAKTRILRGQNKSKTNEEKEEDPEVFDDTDFYQQLLRDVIESRGDGIGGTEDWMALQRERKAKKKVDTKASKGRKLRYHVHEKLQNFMVPVPVVGAWHEEQIDELFASLLGRGYEHSIEDDGAGVDRTLEVESAVKDGFKVFG